MYLLVKRISPSLLRLHPFFFAVVVAHYLLIKPIFVGFQYARRFLLFTPLVMLFDSFNESREIYHDGDNGILIGEVLVYTVHTIRREGCDGRETFAGHQTAAKAHNRLKMCICDISSQN